MSHLIGWRPIASRFSVSFPSKKQLSRLSSFLVRLHFSKHNIFCAFFQKIHTRNNSRNQTKQNFCAIFFTRRESERPPETFKSHPITLLFFNTKKDNETREKKMKRNRERFSTKHWNYSSGLFYADESAH